MKALKEIKFKGGKGKELAILGIIISGLNFVLYVFLDAFSSIK